ncbi:MAG TPA: hypothetical protein VIR57_12360 [Chloroflexota bacterium]|jgi:hypothetical protein
MADAEPYWLMDVDSNNMIGAYETEDEALRVVLDTIELYGEQSDAVLTLGLTHAGSFIGEGAALASLAMKRFPEPHRRSA